jgi:phosphoglycerate dehydrogenase-like enzyme
LLQYLLSRTSRIFLELLAPFEFGVMASDDYLSFEEAEELGVAKKSLEKLMSECDFITLHHADIPKNWNLINKDNLRLMKEGAR